MFIKEKQQLVEMSLKLYNEKLIVGTWGNLSIRVKNGEQDVFLVTPSGMDYEKTSLDDIVVLDENGVVLQGKRKPTSELSMHLKIYKERSDVNAVIHTHSTCATACAVSGIPIPMIVEDMVMHIGGEVRVAKYALPGTDELANNVVSAMKDRYGVLLKNHGSVGVGKDIDAAYKSCILIEKSAQIFIYAKSLGNVDYISEEDARTMVENYNTKYGQK